MGILLFLLVAFSYKILKYFKLAYIIKKSILNRVLYHILESILLIYAFYLIYADDFSLVLSLSFIVFISLPASIGQIIYDKEDK